MSRTLTYTILFAFVAFVIGQCYIILPTLTQILDVKTLDEHPYLLIVYYVAAISAAIGAGYFDLKYSAKHGLLFSLASASIGMFLLAASRLEIPYLIFAQLFLGMSTGGAFSSLNILAVEHISKLSPHVLLFFYAAFPLGSATVPAVLLSYQQEKMHAWQEIPLYLAFGSLFLFMIAKLIVTETGEQARIGAKLKGLRWMHVPYMLVAFCISIPLTVMQTWGDNSPDAGVAFTSLFLLSMAVGGFLVGLVKIFLPNKYLYPLLAIGAFAGFFIPQPELGPLIVGACAWSLLPLSVYYAERYDPSVKELVSGIIVASYILGKAVIVIDHQLTKYAADSNYSFGYLALLPIILITFIPILLAKRNDTL